MIIIENYNETLSETIQNKNHILKTLWLIGVAKASLLLWVDLPTSCTKN